MKVLCSHCQLEFPEKVMILDKDSNGETLYFCCRGCQGVYNILHEENLDSFYNKIGNNQLAPPTEKLLDSSTFDSESFQKEYIKNKNGFSEISLIIEGIHCSACVWLNEQVLYDKEGVLDASINFSTHRAKILFDKDKIKLSEIIETIRAIGYDAYPFEVSEEKNRLDKERRDYYIRLSVAIFGTMNVMWIAVALYTGFFTGIEQKMKNILNIAEWIISTPVLFYSGWIFFKGAYFSLKNRFVNMDLLVATGAVLTYFYSIYITLNELGEAYFDSVSMIITFILVGKFLELLSKRNISENLDLISKYQPKEVEILREDNKTEKISVEDVVIGDIIIVRAGERVGIDGTIINGEGSLDESSLTGEFIPVKKIFNDEVLAGTLLIEGYLQIKAKENFQNSRISKLVELLEDALNKKPKIENIANSISGIFSTVILTLSLFTFFGWYLFTQDFNTSFIIAVSVIIIACPCALGLATPIATLIGLNLGIKRGLLFKEAKHLETVAKAKFLAIDKTGTITEGKPIVSKFTKIKNFDEKLLISLLKSSKHPISQGVLNYFKNHSETKIIKFENIETLPAKGVKANFQNIKLAGGNYTLMESLGIQNIPKVSQTHYFYSVDNEIVAIFELEDKIREFAKESFEKIKKLGVEITILSGDTELAVKKVASQVAINNFLANLTPEDKLNWIREKQKVGNVIMVGDGVNDTLALGTANIGISMGSGTDIAIEVSDIILQKDKLDSLYTIFKISKTTLTLIKQNLFLSFIYNSITIPLAIAGYVIPLVSAISMSISSLIVVLNSIRVNWKFK
jgi:Cu+-exporting ATPase